jgi:type IV secretory pathway VirB10-like protein
MLLVLLLVIAFLGCERKQVYVPPESDAPPPASPSYSAPQPVAPPVQQTLPVTKAPEVRGQETHVSTPPPLQKQIESQPTPAAAKTPQPKESKKEKAAKSPQRQASMQQVNQARGQLEKGRSDAAIRTLEKAVRIDPGNGEAFILLARAWRQKGERRKALEFAKKAELLYQKQPAKLKEVYLLESDLYHELGDATRAR